jgi:3-oxoacyl-[acyl-carrier protein] reductase
VTRWPNHQTAVVTGGSSGIGRSIAIALADAGVDSLIVHYRENESGAEETAEIVRERGCDAAIFAADLVEADDRQALVDTAVEQLGEINVWVNNAGADVLTGEAEKLDFEAKLRLLMEVDVLGTIALTRLLVPQLLGQRGSPPTSLIFLGWDQALEGMEGEAGEMFSPVKAAVMGYAASLAQSVAPQIRVNTVAPGWIRTAWAKETSDYWHQRAKSQSLMERWGHPDDVAKAVVYLADPNNTFVTGQTINVNGGWNRRHNR